MKSISLEEAIKAVRFVRHIEEHLKVMERLDDGPLLEVCCKICDMTINQINEESENEKNV